MLLKITEYKKYLILEWNFNKITELVEKDIIGNPKKIEDVEIYLPLDNPDNNTQVNNCAKNLGMSKEAVNLIETAKYDHKKIDGVPFIFGENQFEISGLPSAHVLSGDEITGFDETINVSKHIEIPNDVPEGAKDFIDETIELSTPETTN